MDSRDENRQPTQKVPNSAESNVKRQRRTRVDELLRNYKCSCGRAYLSYPALYTHIKTKHAGKAPGIIQMPQTERATRLKKYTFREEDELESLDADGCFNQLLNFLNSFGYRQLDYNVYKLFEKIRPQESASLVDAIVQCDDIKPNYVMTDKNIYNISIDHTFARFIIKMCNKVDLKMLQEIVVLLLIWRRVINKSYQKFQKEQYSCYSRDSNCTNVLEVVNELIMTQFEEHSSSFKKALENCRLFDAEKRMLNITKFVFIFSKWLFAAKYTNTKLQINSIGTENDDMN